MLSGILGDELPITRMSPEKARQVPLEKRRKLMEAWATYCERPASNVVHIGKRKSP
jgi:hypothetical protein